MICRRCETRGKTWDGDDPKCAFATTGVFSKLNWNCATMNALRDVAERFDSVVWNDDQNAVLLPFETAELPAAFLILGWYKRSGCVETAAVLSIQGVFEHLDLETAKEILEQYP